MDDVDGVVVRMEDARIKAASWNISFIPTSAKASQVSELMTFLTDSLVVASVE